MVRSAAEENYLPSSEGAQRRAGVPEKSGDFRGPDPFFFHRRAADFHQTGFEIERIFGAGLL